MKQCVWGYVHAGMCFLGCMGMLKSFLVARESYSTLSPL